MKKFVSFSSLIIKIIFFIVAFTIIIFIFYLFFIPPKPTGVIYNTPEEMAKEANIGDRASFDRKLLEGTIDNSKGITVVSTTFSCEKKSNELTECVWQSKLTDTKIIIAFPKDLGMSPGNGTFNTVIVLTYLLKI